MARLSLLFGLALARFKTGGVAEMVTVTMHVNTCPVSSYSLTKTVFEASTVTLSSMRSPPSSSLSLSALSSSSNSRTASTSLSSTQVSSNSRSDSITSSTLLSSTPSSSSSALTTSSTSVNIDGFVNAGNPFVIELPQVGGSSGLFAKRAPILQRNWVMSNGYTTTNVSLAAKFIISSDGQLSADGRFESTDASTDWQIFAVSEPDSVGSITRTFFARDGGLHWVNQHFGNDGGEALFCREPPGRADNATMVVYFRGQATCDEPITPQPLLVGSPSISPVSTIAKTWFSPASSASRSMQSNSPVLVSPDGSCGPAVGPNGESYSCYGWSGGVCCNVITKFCETTNFACGGWCLFGFGQCEDVVSISSAAKISRSSASSSSYSKLSSTSSKSSSSSTTSLSTLSSSTPSVSATPIASAEPKRGLVYIGNNLFPQDDFIWSRTGTPISWYYNYEYVPTGIYNNTLEYVPQLWGDFDNTFIDSVLQLKADGMIVTYVLGFNEPDGPFSEGGSNITPERAADLWLSDIEPLRASGIKLGAPAVTGSERGMQWLHDFFTLCALCHFDFIAVHVYGNNGTAAYWVTQHHARFPSYPLWLTEFADPYADLAISDFENMAAIDWLDSLPYMVRYSYFGTFRSYQSNVGYNATLLSACGELTTLGNYYMNVGGQGNKNVPGIPPEPNPCPYGAYDVGCRWSNGTYYVEPTTDKAFFIECYTDYYGGDLPGTVEITNFTKCIELCANSVTPCVDISWGNGPCYLKGTLNEPPRLNYNDWGARLTTLPSSISASIAQQSSVAAASQAVSQASVNSIASASQAAVIEASRTAPGSGITPAPGWQYIGCMWDGPRALVQAITFDQNMNQEFCMSYANLLGYNYAGVEFSTECYVGDSIANPSLNTLVPDSSCSFKCLGNTDEACGAPSKLNIFIFTGLPTGAVAATTRTSSGPAPTGAVATSISSAAAAFASSAAVASSIARGSCGRSLNIPSPTDMPGMACISSDTQNTFGNLGSGFNVKLGNVNAATLYVSDSGVLSFVKGSTAWLNRPLPQYRLPDSQFNGNTQPANVVFPFFADQTVAANGRDGIWYYTNSSYLVIQWRTTYRNDPNEHYDYTVEYTDGVDGTYKFRYYAVGSSLRPVVGLQSANSAYAQWNNLAIPIVNGSYIACTLRGGQTSGTCINNPR